MHTSTPTQSQLLAKTRDEVRLAHKKRYRGVIGLGIGAAGLAATLAGMPLIFSAGLFLLAAVARAILKAV